MAVESYSGEEIEDQQGDIVFSRELSSTAHSLGGNILLCDDLSDTGLTLNKSIDGLSSIDLLEIILRKFELQFYGKNLNQLLNLITVLKNLKIVLGSQPFEKYEEIRIEDLKKAGLKIPAFLKSFIKLKT